MKNIYDQEQQEIAKTRNEPRETNPIIPNNSNEDEEENNDIRNEEEVENNDNRYEDEGESENNMIEKAEVQEKRRSTHIRKPVEQLEQDDLHTVGKKSNL